MVTNLALQVPVRSLRYVFLERIPAKIVDPLYLPLFIGKLIEVMSIAVGIENRFCE